MAPQPTAHPTTAAVAPSAAPFTLAGPLPRGTVVIQASAGTGKTYTIAGLVTRFIAEGHVTLDQVLAVTFTRMAARRLRGDIRDRMRDVRGALATGVGGTTDGAVTAVRALGPAAVDAAVERLERALAEIDSANIDTIHGFCGTALALAGLAAGVPAANGDEPIDASSLAREATTDAILRRFPEDLEQDHAFEQVTKARPSIAAAIEDPSADFNVDGCLTPRPAAQGTNTAATSEATPKRTAKGAAGSRSRAAQVPAAHAIAVQAVAADAHQRYGEQLERERILTFNRLVDQVRRTVTGPAGQAATAALRGTFRLVLVDEFQDTDGGQWEILEHVFVGHADVFLVGDPKQAIYRFRGGDIATYLRATAGRECRTLATNFRSSQAVVDGVEALLRGVPLGDERIIVEPVLANPDRDKGQDPVGPAVSLRYPLGPDGRPASSGSVGTAEAAVVQDMCQHLRSLVAAPPATPDGDPVGYGDIAVLVRSGTQARTVETALRSAGVPCAVRGAASVFASEAARDWSRLLRALEEPRATAPARDVAIGPFCDGTPQALLSDPDLVLDLAVGRIRTLHDLAAARGVTAAIAAALADPELPSRVAALPDGPRRATDLRHVAELILATASTSNPGLAALRTWLDEQIATVARAPEREQRVSQGGQAVIVQTIHGSKGLEYPVVYVPFGWRASPAPKLADYTQVLDGRTHRFVDFAGVSAVAKDRAAQEARGEELRMLYVAFTRAATRLIVYWAAYRDVPRSPLQIALTARAAGTATPAAPAGQPPAGTRPTGKGAKGTRAKDHAAWLAALATDAAVELCGFSVEPADEDPTTAPAIRTEPADRSPQVTEARSAAATPPLTTAPVREWIDHLWTRTSYSGLTATLHAAEPTGTPAPPSPDAVLGDLRDDEPATQPVEVAGPRDASPTSRFAGLPHGAAFGTLVHEVLERTSTGGSPAHSRRTDLATAAAAGLAAHPLPGVTADALVTALEPALHTPLGPLAGDHTLASIPDRDRLTELDFETPLCTKVGTGGRGSRAGATMAQIADLWATTIDGEDPTAGYPAALARAASDGRPLRGLLTGSIDAVLRVPDPAAGFRYLVVDYKTNRLDRVVGAVAGPQRDHPYAGPALRRAMAEANYPLQALLYSVALHRYLRQALQGYRPEVHLGGVLYLFLRGMDGPATARGDDGVPHGVFSWKPPTALVTGVSELLANPVPQRSSPSRTTITSTTPSRRPA